MVIWPEPRHGSFLGVTASNRVLCDQLEHQLSQAEQSRRELLEALEGRLPERPEERHAAIA
ncbi:hypothetical protein NZK32_14525 [Cyanobium sp. FGCU-52]|jgi:hypothetical protein|nr:hypothetical protein [Cyanobium sp. FGCU52]